MASTFIYHLLRRASGFIIVTNRARVFVTFNWIVRSSKDATTLYVPCYTVGTSNKVSISKFTVLGELLIFP